MTTMAFPMIASLLAAITVGVGCNVTKAAPNGGFSVQLIHRDSSNSPLYNPNQTPTQRLGNALKRSIDRVHRFALNPTSSPLPYFEVTASNGEYLMNISIGTPPSPILAVADTGSDVVWTQCKPCSSCYDQDAPLFDPAASTTYKTVPCSSNACSSLQPEGAYCSADGVCHYKVGYGDNSHTFGDLALDTLTMGSTAAPHVAFPDTLIGCGHDNAGTFSRNGSGVVGLGRGAASLVTQLGSSIGGKFSYCLVPLGADNGLTSSMNFGQNAVVSGSADVVSTPLSSHVSQPTFYFLKLEAVTVGTKRLEFGGSSGDGEEGNIIIDSGTTVTLLPTDFFTQLSDAVDSQVVGGEKARDPQGFLSLCYVADYSDLRVPPITFHFQGADVELTRDNTFVPVSDTVTCLAFYGSDDASIYGNVAQQNFLIGYDLQKGTLSFKPTDCSRN